MSTPAAPHPALAALLHAASSPRFTAALAIAAIAVAVLAHTIVAVIDWAGLIGVLASLCALAGVSLVVRWRELDVHALLPISLLAFVAWSALSLIWSEYQWATVGGLAYQLAFGFLGVFVALSRDTIQIVRAFGDVLRVVLVASLVLELLSGILLDLPFVFLGIQGNLDQAGPIQGLAGSRNQLGIVSLVAIVTFVVELSTRSVRRDVALWSIGLACLVAVLTRSPLTAGTAVILALGAVALYALRKTRAERRLWAQVALVVTASVVGAFAWAFRSPLIDAFSAGGELDYRVELWERLGNLIALNPLEGWGWIGAWRPNMQPFLLFGDIAGRAHTSAVNAFLDVYFQLGFVGLTIFIGLVGLAFVRSWLLASNQRTVSYIWPGLMLLVLIAASFAQSSILVEFGWMTFVACVVKASQRVSWRNLVRDFPGAGDRPLKS